MSDHHIDYERLVFGVYSNILKNDRMSSPRVEMLQASLTTNQAAGRPLGRLPQGNPKGETRGIERVNMHHTK
jgi:hypothetical protein